MSKVACPHEECGKKFSGVGGHWRYNPDHRPDISTRQHEIITGLVMGDGSVYKSGESNSHIQCEMINKEFLEWVDEEMGILGNGVKFYMSAEESAKKARESGFRPNAKAENYHDKYAWRSRAHPEFNQYRDWYSTGRKRFPDDLKLTPLITKVWFCCDGSKEVTDSGRPRIIFSCSNESDREDYIRELFSDLLVCPSFYREKMKKYKDKMRVGFGVDDSEWLWDYMREPLPGFKNKWQFDSLCHNDMSKEFL